MYIIHNTDFDRDIFDIACHGIVKMADSRIGYNFNWLLGSMIELSEEFGENKDEYYFRNQVCSYFVNRPIHEEYIEERMSEDTHEDFATWLIDMDMIDIDEVTKNFSDIFTDFQFGSVGYSPWAYYVARKETYFEYIRSIYEGENHFDIENTRDGEWFGSIYCATSSMRDILLASGEFKEEDLTHYRFEFSEELKGWGYENDLG